MFEHEKLQVYQLSRELNREIWRITKISSRGYSDHLDQLVRAGSSITRNLAEGSGEWSPKEKAKFYRYAKRSACECAAALDVMVDYGMLREHDTTQAKELLRRIVPMVVKLVQLFEGGAPSRPSKRAKSPSLSPSTGPRIPGPGPGPWPDPDRMD
jgi:four helix bundle protein